MQLLKFAIKNFGGQGGTTIQSERGGTHFLFCSVRTWRPLYSILCPPQALSNPRSSIGTTVDKGIHEEGGIFFTIRGGEFPLPEHRCAPDMIFDTPNSSSSHSKRPKKMPLVEKFIIISLLSHPNHQANSCVHYFFINLDKSRFHPGFPYLAVVLLVQCWKL